MDGHWVGARTGRSKRERWRRKLKEGVWTEPAKIKGHLRSSIEA